MADISFLALAMLAYFAINLVFAFRIKRVLGKQGYSVSFSKTVVAQYGGMLASDVTPGKAGYLIMPILLKGQGVPVPTGLSCIIGIQSVEFFVKVFGSMLAIIFILIQFQLEANVLLAALAGVVIMLVGGTLLSIAVFYPRILRLFQPFYKLPLLGGKLRQLIESRGFLDTNFPRRVLPEIALLAGLSWILKGAEWTFIGYALGITAADIPFFVFFLIHPLITALSFIPLTPSGIGFQEGALIGILFVMGIPIPTAVAFSILTRVLVMLEDLVGLSTISRSGARIFTPVSKLVTRQGRT